MIFPRDEGSISHTAPAAVRALVFVLCALILGCSNPNPIADAADAAVDVNADAADARARSDASGAWNCPIDWVASERGGCGPAVLLCVADGGAAIGACDGIDLSRSHPVTNPDGTTHTSFYRAGDASIRGGWPAPEWRPDAGVPACPPGWRRTADRGCDPGLRADCPSGSAALPGGSCTRTAEVDCPASDYADVGAETVGATVFHVRASAEAMGADGSELRPYPTLTGAITKAPAGAWILIAAGSYPESLVVQRNVHLVGQCAAHVRLTGSASGTASTVAVIASGSLDLRNVFLTGRGNGVSVTAGGAALIRSASIEATVGAGISARGAGAMIAAENVFISSTQRAVDGTPGMGLSAREGANARLTFVSLSNNRGSGVEAVSSAGALTMNDCVVRDTQPDRGADGVIAGGQGVSLSAATAALLRVVIAHNASAGIEVTGPAAVLAVTDSSIRDTVPAQSNGSGYGLRVTDHAVATVSGSEIAGNTGIGASVSGEGSRLQIVASLVRGTQELEAHDDGTGVQAEAGATLSVDRVEVRDHIAQGIRAVGTGTTATLRECYIHDQYAATQPFGGNGFSSNLGSTVRADHVLVDRTASSAVLVDGLQSVLEISDSTLRGTRVRRDGVTGNGIYALRAGVVRATRVLIEGNSEYGAVSGDPGTRIELSECAVTDMRGLSNGTFGVCLASGLGGSLIARHTLLQRCREGAAGAAFPGATMSLDDVIVIDVLTGVRDVGFGVGASAGARLDVSRLAVLGARGVALASLPFGPTGTISGTRVDARDVFIRDVALGHVQFNSSMPLEVAGTTVAYGLYAGVRCSLSTANSTLINGGWGFYNGAGVLSIRTGLIMGQQIAGAFNTSTRETALLLEDVAIRGNVDNEVRADDSLPDVQFAPPARPCAMPPCP